MKMQQKNYKKLDESFMHSAMFIDRHGNETKITATMIDAACEKLIAADKLANRKP